MKLLNLVLAILIALAATNARANSLCDEQHPFTALSGQKLIDCRINGERAKARYTGLEDKEEATYDADSNSVSGFVKKNDYNYCFTSLERTSYQCSQTLDAKSGKILPLSASISNKVVHAQVCATTNGTDVCNSTTPCCSTGDVCVTDASGIGFCD